MLESESVEFKTCLGCQQNKPLSAYTRHSCNGLLRPRCKECNNRANREWYKKNKKARCNQITAYRAKDPRRWVEARKRAYWADPERNRARKKQNHRSLRGYAHYLYCSIRMRIKHSATYKNRSLLFTKQEFFDWLDNNNYYFLFCQWEQSGFHRRYSPSVDRIKEGDTDYSLDNIQLLTQSENTRKYAKTCPRERNKLGQFFNNKGASRG